MKEGFTEFFNNAERIDESSGEVRVDSEQVKKFENNDKASDHWEILNSYRSELINIKEALTGKMGDCTPIELQKLELRKKDIEKILNEASSDEKFFKNSKQPEINRIFLPDINKGLSADIKHIMETSGGEYRSLFWSINHALAELARSDKDYRMILMRQAILYSVIPSWRKDHLKTPKEVLDQAEKDALKIVDKWLPEWLEKN